MKSSKDFRLQKNKVYFAGTEYGQEEIDAVVKCLQEGWLGPAKYTDEFEKQIAKLFDKKYGVMVNSGSSALTLVADLLDIQEGDEIITCATGFPTTINPFLRRGATVVLVDTDPYSLSPNLDQIRDAITPKTKAIVVAHIMGATLDMPALRTIADDYELKLIEDSCDSLGATIAGKPTGYWADISVTSFYPSHIITAGGGGGMVCVDSPEEEAKLRVLRDWGRYENSEKLESRLANPILGSYYDAKFVYEELGHNLKATEIQASFGLAQLPKLNKFNQVRRTNYGKLFELVSAYGLRPVIAYSDASPSWLSFPFICSDRVERYELTVLLEKNNIQTRPILAGNLFKHPAYKDAKIRVPIIDLDGADFVFERGLSIGLHPAIKLKQLRQIKRVLDTYYG